MINVNVPVANHSNKFVLYQILRHIFTVKHRLYHEEHRYVKYNKSIHLVSGA